MELKYFVDCIKNNVTPDRYQTIDSIADTFKVTEAEQQSVVEGRRIEVKY